MMHKSTIKRIVAVFSALALFVLSCPLSTVTLSAEQDDWRVADPSTMDDWQRYFGPAVLSTENAGLVWTDKSVLTSADAFGEIGVSLRDEENGFLVALSAIAADTTSDSMDSYDFPTLVGDDEELSGYISFVDKIGQGMSVTDIKGIVIDDTLFSGAMLSRNFVIGGGSLGTFNDPKPLGDELVRAVQERLGIDARTARDLLGLAYAHDQLHYVNDQDFSNYIGWYANAAGEFLGFWYDGITTMPDPADPQLTDVSRPAYIIRSYGFLGAVDESHGVTETDLMYATVQVREHIQTGEESMVFALPAALIPTVTYEINADAQGEWRSFAVGGASHPIRLVYEVALDEAIRDITVSDVAQNLGIKPNADGSYSFYTNRFEADYADGYGKVNPYSYFVPSKANSRYYYTQDTPIYAATDGTLYTGGQPDVTAVYYRAYTVYGQATTPYSKAVYERVSSEALSNAVRHDDGYWYIPSGTVRTMPSDYQTDKTANLTASLPYANKPFVDARYTYYVGATLGNNGCITVMPATGLRLTNTAQNAEEGDVFSFSVSSDDPRETAVYDAVLIRQDQTMQSTTVAFQDGVAQVSLSDGQRLCIVGLPIGATYLVTEMPHADYKTVSAGGVQGAQSTRVTVEERKLAEVSFVNVRKGYGGVTIVNRVVHDFGASYQMPEKWFTVQVQLPQEYADTVLQAALTSDSSLTSVTTDENAAFTVSLRHGEQFELINLKEGTVVKIKETDIPVGFVPTYYGAGEKDTDFVTIRENTSLSLIVANTYQYGEVEDVDIQVGGTKHLQGREQNAWLDEDMFTFALQKYTDDGWETVATETADRADPTFDFNRVMKIEHFTKSGVYSYRVVELASGIPGMLDDQSIHSFSVTVGDPDMCGHLSILEVISHRDDTVQGDRQNGWSITTDFTNVYAPSGRADAVLDVNARLDNPSQSDRVSCAGFRFGLYAENDEEPSFVSDDTNALGEARLIASFDEVGTYMYTLKAIVPAAPISGMQYSTDSYEVRIVVSEDTDGTKRADVFLADDPVFYNTYAPQKAQLSPAVKIQLQGRVLRENEFTFELSQNGTVLANGTNGANGTVLFDQPLSFDTVGDYYADVTELSGSVAGIVYDPMVYRLHITVKDSGDGTLSAHYHVINTAEDTITFFNRYEPTPAKVILRGTKTLVGRTLINDEFDFVLVETDGKEVRVLSAFNHADGRIVFEPLYFDEVGDYRFTVHEVQSSVVHDIRFDTTAYEVTVTVYDEGDGQLRSTVTVMNGTEAVDTIAFVNRYAPVPIEVTLEGVKTLRGGTLQDGAFSFELYQADEQWHTLGTLQTVCNLANGHFSFAPLVFEEGGEYRFVVKEVYSGQTVNGITYDDEVYYITVHVTDNERGTLLAETTIHSKEGRLAPLLTFENTYAHVPTTTPMTVTTSTTTKTVTQTTVCQTVTTTSKTDTATSGTSHNTTPTTTVSVPSITAPSSGNSPQTGEVLWWGAWLVMCGALSALWICGKKRTQN